MDTDGSNPTRLTANAGVVADASAHMVDENPAWSPDGTMLVFDRAGAEGTYDVYVMDADGTGEVQLTDDPAEDGDPNWSPDGAQVAFESDRDGDLDVYLVDAGGGEPVQVTDELDGQDECATTPCTRFTDIFPSWHPSGERIAFVTDRSAPMGSDKTDIAVTDLAGERSIILAEHPADDNDPDWSPDGSMLVFESNRVGGETTDIFVMEPDGTGVKLLTDDPADDEDPDWA